MPEQRFFVGVDIGGTFTDLVLAEGSNQKLYKVKTLTTPADPVEGVMKAVRDALSEAGAAAGEFQRVVHATTLATNLILERKGARLGFVTTAGFGDMFHMSKQERSPQDRYNLLCDRQPPLMARDMVVEINERLNAHGEVVIPLDITGSEAKIKELAGKKPGAVAICLLHSYVNPAHERAVGELLRKHLPDAFIALSTEVWPEFQEYERASTTMISAYVGPMMSDYIGRLAQELRLIGATCSLLIMQSSGAVMPAQVAAQKAVYSIESGPAAGVIAAAHLGLRCGQPNLLSFDMGGTTAKVGLIQRGEPKISHDFRVGAGVSGGVERSGEPVKIPVIDLAEVGAGGGSIAWIDRGGFLHVGPASAGAAPGPACYGLGGDQPTVTDANVILGYLNPDYFLGGKMVIYPEKSLETIAKNVAEQLKLDVVSAAHGIYQLANTYMGSAVRMMTVQRGIDPREFAVMAFGGAGPIHIVRVAEQFNIPTIIIPPSPGLASAFGLLVSDIAYDYVTTNITTARRISASELRELFDNLERAGRQALAVDVTEKDMVIQRTVDVRFVHQKHEHTVPVPPGPITEGTPKAVEKSFRDLYFESFRVRPNDPVEFVNYGLRAVGVVAKPEIAKVPADDADARRALKGSRKAYFAETQGFVETPVYDRTKLRNGDFIQGPAILEEPDSTTICPPSYTVGVDQFFNLIIKRR